MFLLFAPLVDLPFSRTESYNPNIARGGVRDVIKMSMGSKKLFQEDARRGSRVELQLGEDRSEGAKGE
jgi:hypothetical protein